MGHYVFYHKAQGKEIQGLGIAMSKTCLQYPAAREYRRVGISEGRKTYRIEGHGKIGAW